jgi:hypothetical protein
MVTEITAANVFLVRLIKDWLKIIEIIIIKSAYRYKMKKKLFFLCVLSLPVFINAQNVGINTNSPQATLDVRGNQRFGGASQYLSYDSLSGKASDF